MTNFSFNKLIPELSVSSILASKIFYIDLLGFKLEYERIEDKFAFLSLEGIQLMIEERNGGWETGELIRPFGRGINFQMEIKDVEALYQHLEKRGVVFFRKLMVNQYQTLNGIEEQKEFLIQDPDGYLLRFC